MSEQYVILEGGDFDHPYTDAHGKPRIFASREAAEQARRVGDVAVPLSDWEGWDKDV